jgi:two-component system chemotaxis response regulator CheY
MFKKDDPMLKEYLDDSREQLVIAERDLLAVEKERVPFQNENLTHVLRIVRTIRGGAGLFNLIKVSELAHEMETVLALILSLESIPDPMWITSLLLATDRLTVLLETGGPMDDVDISAILSDLTRLRSERSPLVGANRQVSPSQRSDRKGEPLRVLLAEDDFACRLLLQTFLSRYGECHVAVNGKEAVQAFSEALSDGQGYDLICMDIMMPEMDGDEAVRKIRTIEECSGIRSPYGAKIFMTTTVNDIREVFRCFKELCDAYLLKPIDLAQLLKHMKSYDLTR